MVLNMLEPILGGETAMAAKVDLLDDIINHIDPEEVPVEFIVMAKVTTVDGEERIVTGEELEAIMENPERHNIAEARVILDVRKIRASILREVKTIFDVVHRA